MCVLWMDFNYFISGINCDVTDNCTKIAYPGIIMGMVYMSYIFTISLHGLLYMLLPNYHLPHLHPQYSQ